MKRKQHHCGLGGKCLNQKNGRGKRLSVNPYFAKGVLKARRTSGNHVTVRSQPPDEKNPTEPHIYCIEACKGFCSPECAGECTHDADKPGRLTLEYLSTLLEQPPASAPTQPPQPVAAPPAAAAHANVPRNTCGWRSDCC